MLTHQAGEMVGRGNCLPEPELKMGTRGTAVTADTRKPKPTGPQPEEGCQWPEQPPKAMSSPPQLAPDIAESFASDIAQASLLASAVEHGPGWHLCRPSEKLKWCLRQPKATAF